MARFLCDALRISLGHQHAKCASAAMYVICLSRSFCNCRLSDYGLVQPWAAGRGGGGRIARFKWGVVIAFLLCRGVAQVGEVNG